jgi:hypothetical protein
MQSTPSNTSNTTNTTPKDKVPTKCLKILPDGLEVESYGEGGYIQNVNTDIIQWSRDIQPFFASFYIILATHLFYYFTGNLAILLFLSHCKVIYSHVTGYEHYLDRNNIARKSERAFFNDKRFFIPLYLTVGGGTLTWIWGMCLFSDNVGVG